MKRKLLKIISSKSSRGIYLCNKLSDLFPNYNIETLNTKFISLENNSHPLITEMWHTAIIITKENESRDNKNIELKLIHESYELLRQKSMNRWTIIGDETGTGKRITHFWMVIPPNESLPQLSPFFHGAGNKETLREPLENISKLNNIKLFAFNFEKEKKSRSFRTKWRYSLFYVVGNITFNFRIYF